MPPYVTYTPSGLCVSTLSASPHTPLTCSTPPNTTLTALYTHNAPLCHL